MKSKTSNFESNSNGLSQKAYLGKLAQDLLYLSSEQVLQIYTQRGLVIPVETSSTLAYLYHKQSAALSDIAGALDVPHQLAAQRVAKLLKLNLIDKQPDHQDARRSVLQLTVSGDKQAELLNHCMEDMAVVYAALYREIDCDLPVKLQLAIDALKHKNLATRFNEILKSE